MYYIAYGHISDRQLTYDTVWPCNILVLKWLGRLQLPQSTHIPSLNLVSPSVQELGAWMDKWTVRQSAMHNAVV